jgi:hypothetical protein
MIETSGISAKWFIGSIALFHIGVAALSVGVAFIVTVAQITAYRKKIRRYDLFAKRSQLFHVCIYNVGTINAIGLVFALSGLYPQFWSQIFVHMFWPFIIEEVLFLLLATTLTFHYFFWDRLWGHKKLQIFTGALLIPLFFLQMYFINGVGGFMLTPGFAEGEASLSRGLLGWDKFAFYNPSFLMLQLHRSFGNVSYAGFFLAGWCGIRLLLTQDPLKTEYYEDSGRLAFFVAFAALLSQPIIGYFYSWVLKIEANEAFLNLMIGKGDIISGGINWWWMKNLLVAAMIGMAIAYFRKVKAEEKAFSLPGIMVYGIAGFYLMFYLALGMVMTWKFFWWSVVIAVGGGFLATHLINYHKGSARGLFLLMGIISLCTLLLGGYVREASRPRFVNRVSHYDDVYIPRERSPVLMVEVEAELLEELLKAPEPTGAASLIRKACAKCHTLDRVKNYQKDDWENVVNVMVVYGAKLRGQDIELVTQHLKEGLPY